MNLKIMALVLLSVIFAYEIFMDIIGYLSKNNPVPENVRDIYDEKEYKRWKEYHSEISRVSVISTVLSFVVNFLLILFDVYSYLAFGNNVYLCMITVVIAFVTIDTLLSAIFDYIYSMKIEEKYGFNKMTVKTFIMDKIKSYIIMLALVIGLMSLFILIHRHMGDYIILLFSGVMVALVFAIIFIYPKFSKIFNKFTPLEDGELKTKLTELLERNGYRIKQIQVMDASKRTSKANAYFSGYGKTKTIVLYDTLLSSMSTDEIVAIFAHELGHGLNKDTVKNSAISIIQMIVLVLLAFVTVKYDSIYPYFGFDSLNYGFALILVMLVEFPVISPVFLLVGCAVSRKAEYRADRQAVREGYGLQLIDSLKKLSRDSLSDLSPSEIEVKLSYSHPPLSDRIAAIEREMKKLN